jgi:RES domain-containing protein
MATKDSVPGWADDDGSAARAHGSKWRSENRSAILIVPSFVARTERNVVINDDHPEARRITAGLHQPAWRHERLFHG